MVANGDEEMAEILEDWEHTDGEESILGLNEIDYDQFLLDNPNIEEEQPKEENAELSEQPEFYMNIQDPEPPREELKKLMLDSPTSSLGDVTVHDATYETSDEACLCLLC